MDKNFLNTIISKENIQAVEKIVNKILKPSNLVTEFSVIDSVNINSDSDNFDTVYFFKTEWISFLKKEELDMYSDYSVFYNGESWQFTYCKEHPQTRYEPADTEVIESKEYKYFYLAFIDLVHHIINEQINELISNDDFIEIGE